MRPFAESLKELFHKGADIVVAGSIWKVRAILLCGVFDAPARCLFQEMMQFNGFHGCPFCQSPGETVKTSERGSTHTYPYDVSSRTGHGEERTHADTVSNAKKADKERNPVMGVKGSTWFMFVPKFDIVRGISIDYMHCVLLGVMKMLMHLWFDKSRKGESYNISSKVNEVDQRSIEMASDPREACLNESKKQSLSLLYDPQGSSNRCFYRCLAKYLNIKEEDVISSLEKVMFDNQVIPVFDEVSAGISLNRSTKMHL
ncbi:hypothetical protein AC249_AIPGENE28187 [Exaiptasia diaphana]|nr:hypothetical protein AC249_AIPGENE28187 [Exaiptasia diaphana]